MAEQAILELGDDPSSALTVSETFTAPLCDFLLNALDAKEAVKTAMDSPLILAECRRVNDTVQRLARPIGRDGVYRALQPCLALWGGPRFKAGEEELVHAWIEAYQMALHRLPKEALEHAVSEWVANGKPYFPKPSELNLLAKAKAVEVGILAWRCRRIVEESAQRRPPEISREERAQVAAGLAALRDEMRASTGARREAMRESYPRSSPHEVADRLRQRAGASGVS